MRKLAKNRLTHVEKMRMPELPEVETTCRGITPHIINQQIQTTIIRQAKLRWPIPDDLPELLSNSFIHAVKRRAKYLLLEFDKGHVLIHLGMSGSLRIVDNGQAFGKHDHIDLVFYNEKALRLTDPRRFGAVLWLGKSPFRHFLLNKLGPEPFSEKFNGSYLYECSRNRKLSVKQFIMDQQIVAGIGNIYANEALFFCGIRPTRRAGNISKKRYHDLTESLKTILEKAIKQGGTTLKDFVGSDGKPGYFSQQLQVYGKAGLPCPSCNTTLKEIKISNRSTIFCQNCQK
jgi:formamidopyrimidine-DNA glycosylase